MTRSRVERAARLDDALGFVSGANRPAPRDDVAGVRRRGDPGLSPSRSDLFSRGSGFRLPGGLWAERPRERLKVRDPVTSVRNANTLGSARLSATA